MHEQRPCLHCADAAELGVLGAQDEGDMPLAGERGDQILRTNVSPSLHVLGRAKDEGDKMLVVERGDLVFVFNFHPVTSFSDYRVGAYLPGPYKARAAAPPVCAPGCLHAWLRGPRGGKPQPCLIEGTTVAGCGSNSAVGAPAAQVALSSDEAAFGGWRNVSKESDVEYATAADDHDGRPHSFTVYAPSRTVAVYAPAQTCDAKARASSYT